MDSSAAATTQHRQVLALCVGYLYDTKTLINVSLASFEAHILVTEQVQHQLPSLVQQTITAGVKHAQPPPGALLTWNIGHVIQPLQWLLSTAGAAAINTPAVAAALLHASPRIPAVLQAVLPDMVCARGLQLSMQQLAHAAKRRVKGLGMWIWAADRNPGSYSDTAQMAWLQYTSADADSDRRVGTFAGQQVTCTHESSGTHACRRTADMWCQLHNCPAVSAHIDFVA
jgi:hypothetical protein